MRRTQSLFGDDTAHPAQVPDDYGRPLTLLALNALVRQAVERALPGDYWVEAEIAELREVHGHCYIELVEKDPHSNTPVAKAPARCWRQAWALIKPHFERTTGQRLAPGMKVLVRVRASFHEAYGFAWVINDIDPTYTLGDLARRRMEILAKLRAEGVLELNKQLPLPLPARRIAVVSSAGAAGYGDFCHQLRTNAYGYRFSVTLFEAAMQGEQVEAGIIAALNAIYAEAETFDCVVIIRGGGAASDLSGFDTLALAENVANFPLPVITGIGHERDTTVLDAVAHTCVKTPTAAAALLIERMRMAEEAAEDMARRLAAAVERRLATERMRLGRVADRLPGTARVASARAAARIDTLATRLAAATRRSLDGQRHRLNTVGAALPTLARRRMENERHRLEMLRQRACALDPELTLRRGYSITTVNGRALRTMNDVKEGDIVVTRLGKGKIKSTVTWKSKK